MKISNVCPNCKRYIFKYGDGDGKFRYIPRAIYKELWNRSYGSYPLGKFYKTKCPVCHRHVAVFEDIEDNYVRQAGPVVVYLCTLGEKPFDPERCANTKSCYGCGILQSQRKAGMTLWYKKKTDEDSPTTT